MERKRERTTTKKKTRMKYDWSKKVKWIRDTGAVWKINCCDARDNSAKLFSISIFKIEVYSENSRKAV